MVSSSTLPPPPPMPGVHLAANPTSAALRNASITPENSDFSHPKWLKMTDRSLSDEVLRQMWIEEAQKGTFNRILRASNPSNDPLLTFSLPIIATLSNVRAPSFDEEIGVVSLLTLLLVERDGGRFTGCRLEGFIEWVRSVFGVLSDDLVHLKDVESVCLGSLDQGSCLSGSCLDTSVGSEFGLSASVEEDGEQDMSDDVVDPDDEVARLESLIRDHPDTKRFESQLRLYDNAIIRTKVGSNPIVSVPSTPMHRLKTVLSALSTVLCEWPKYAERGHSLFLPLMPLLISFIENAGLKLENLCQVTEIVAKMMRKSVNDESWVLMEIVALSMGCLGSMLTISNSAAATRYGILSSYSVKNLNAYDRCGCDWCDRARVCSKHKEDFAECIRTRLGEGSVLALKTICTFWEALADGKENLGMLSPNPSNPFGVLLRCTESVCHTLSITIPNILLSTISSSGSEGSFQYDEWMMVIRLFNAYFCVSDGVLAPTASSKRPYPLSFGLSALLITFNVWAASKMTTLSKALNYRVIRHTDDDGRPISRSSRHLFGERLGSNIIVPCNRSASVRGVTRPEMYIVREWVSLLESNFVDVVDVTGGTRAIPVPVQLINSFGVTVYSALSTVLRFKSLVGTVLHVRKLLSHEPEGNMKSVGQPAYEPSGESADPSVAASGSASPSKQQQGVHAVYNQRAKSSIRSNQLSDEDYNKFVMIGDYVAGTIFSTTSYNESSDSQPSDYVKSVTERFLAVPSVITQTLVRDLNFVSQNFIDTTQIRRDGVEASQTKAPANGNIVDALVPNRASAFPLALQSLIEVVAQLCGVDECLAESYMTGGVCSQFANDESQHSAALLIPELRTLSEKLSQSNANLVNSNPVSTGEPSPSIGCVATKVWLKKSLMRAECAGGLRTFIFE